MKKYVDLLIETVIDKSKVERRVNAASAIIMKYDDDGNKQILLIQRSTDDHWPNHWEVPRGKCDRGKNEDTVKCVKREVKEETGLDIRVIGLIDKFQYLADEGKRLTTCFNYLCKMEDGDQKIKLSHEHQDFQWISEIGQVEMLVLPDQKKTIEKVLNLDRQIVSYPDNEFTVNNKIEEYLRKL